MNQLHRHWKTLVLRGLVAVAFGLLVLFMPGLALAALVLLFGAFFLVDGLIAFFIGISSKTTELIIEGLIGVIIGLYIFFFTAQAIVLFVILVALWAIATGVFEIIAAISLRKYIANEMWLMLAGIVSIFFGVLVMFNPIVSAVAITFLIGIYALVFGGFVIALGFKAKTYKPASSKKSSSKKKKSR